MARQKVIWSKRADNEFKEILEFYIRRNGTTTYSIKLAKSFKHLLTLLSDNPKMGKPTDKESYRIIIRGYYEIIYMLNGHISIVSVWDSRRNPEDKKF